MRVGRRLLSAAFVLLAVGAATSFASVEAACGPGCPATTYVFDGGESYVTGTTSKSYSYETSNNDGPFLAFPGGAEWRIHHGLGALVPAGTTLEDIVVQEQLSFSEYPDVDGGTGGGSAPAAGNQAILLAADGDEVVIKNDTCASFWLRVTITAVDSSSQIIADASAD